ncbi:MAG TPA: hydroxyisourate hydrolase [Streptosporangiaceae bacterium]|nr:hydroxyisourate hydrolase [Streptosporangiaceae bacterium]
MKLSVRVIDCMYGVAASDVQIRLHGYAEPGWHQLAVGRTGPDGWLTDWTDLALDPGTYQLVIDLDGYYATLGTVPLHPRAIVEFRVTDPCAEMHLPLLVTANSVLTYRDGT